MRFWTSMPTRTGRKTRLEQAIRLLFWVDGEPPYGVLSKGPRALAGANFALGSIGSRESFRPRQRMGLRRMFGRSGAGRRKLNVRHIPCGAFVNESERHAALYLEARLGSMPDSDLWVILTNPSYSQRSAGCCFVKCRNDRRGARRPQTGSCLQLASTRSGTDNFIRSPNGYPRLKTSTHNLG